MTTETLVESNNDNMTCLLVTSFDRRSKQNGPRITHQGSCAFVRTKCWPIPGLWIRTNENNVRNKSAGRKRDKKRDERERKIEKGRVYTTRESSR